MDELEEIKRRKLQEYLASRAHEQSVAAQQEAIEAQIKLLVSKLLDENARERLANVRIAKPELARQVELLIIQLYQAGRIAGKINEAQLIKLLDTLSKSKPEWKIKRI